MKGELFRGLRYWQPDLEPGVAGFGSDLDISLVLFYDSLDSVEAEAGALSNSFGGEEGFKDVGFYFGWDTGAIVADLDYYAAVIAVGADSKLALAVQPSRPSATLPSAL